MSARKSLAFQETTDLRGCAGWSGDGVHDACEGHGAFEASIGITGKRQRETEIKLDAGR